jgi:hypothetical protein
MNAPLSSVSAIQDSGSASSMDALSGGDYCVGGLKALLLADSVYQFGVRTVEELPEGATFYDAQASFDLNRRWVADGASVVGQIGGCLEWCYNGGLIEMATEVATWLFSTATLIYLIKYISDFMDIPLAFEEVDLLRTEYEPFYTLNSDTSTEAGQLASSEESDFRFVTTFISLGINLSFTCWMVASLISLIAGPILPVFVTGAFMISGYTFVALQIFRIIPKCIQRVAVGPSAGRGIPSELSTLLPKLHHEYLTP